MVLRHRLPLAARAQGAAHRRRAVNTVHHVGHVSLIGQLSWGRPERVMNVANAFELRGWRVSIRACCACACCRANPIPPLLSCPIHTQLRAAAAVLLPGSGALPLLWLCLLAQSRAARIAAGTIVFSQQGRCRPLCQPHHPAALHLPPCRASGAMLR